MHLIDIIVTPWKTAEGPGAANINSDQHIMQGNVIFHCQKNCRLLFYKKYLTYLFER